MDFHKIYKPITAAPFIRDKSHVEIEPCDALKPYVRCFWGSEGTYVEDTADELAGRLIVPDTCMDVIFRVNFPENKLECNFCGINDIPLFSERQSIDKARKPTEKYEEKSVFGIRFYAWSVAMFSEESMRNVKNGFFDARQFFSELTKELEQKIFDVVDLRQRIEIVESFLLQHINENHRNPYVMEAVGEILKKKGNLKFKELSQEIYVSKRQIERLFSEYIGLSPKSFSSLIRYQNLWSDVFLNPNSDIQDKVFQYGYTDQAHLLHDFKRFHTMSIVKAREYAFRDVAF